MTLMVHAGASAGCARPNTAEPQVAAEPTTKASPRSAEPAATASNDASANPSNPGFHKCTPIYMGATKAGPVIPPGCETGNAPSSNPNRHEPAQQAP